MVESTQVAISCVLPIHPLLPHVVAMADTHASLEMISWTFVQEYYSCLNNDPARLHRFYTKRSSFLHGREGEITPMCVGQQEIHDKVTKLDFRDCKVMVSNVDCQSSASNGIVVMVLGEMSNKGGPSQKFVQTFFLAEQPKGYYVLNDIFRFLNEESDSDAGETDEIA